MVVMERLPSALPAMYPLVCAPLAKGLTALAPGPSSSAAKK